MLALAAFLALPEQNSDTPPQDAFTRAADRTCVVEKRQIAAASRRALAEAGNDPGVFGAALVPIVEEWRLALFSAPPPPDRRDLVLGLDSALRETMAEAGALARVASHGAGEKAVLAQAGEVDRASGRVEKAIASLGLRRCSNLAIGVGRLVSR